MVDDIVFCVIKNFKNSKTTKVIWHLGYFLKKKSNNFPQRENEILRWWKNRGDK